MLASSFEQPFDASIAEREAGKLLRRTAVLAFADGERAGAWGSSPLEGAAELVGIGVLERFRGRGIGAALTSEIARLVFERGADRRVSHPGQRCDPARLRALWLRADGRDAARQPAGVTSRPARQRRRFFFFFLMTFHE